MTYRVEITAEAECDLLSAFDYIAQGSLERAQRWRDNLYSVIETLSKNPLRCSLALEAVHVGCELRVLRFGNYRLLFVVRDQVVYITHIRHGARQELSPGEVPRTAPNE